MTKLLTIITLTSILHLTQSKIGLGKVKVSVDIISPCENNLQLESPLRNFKFQRINRTHKIATAEITFKRDLDENVGLKLIFERNLNNLWMEIPLFPQQNNICKAFALYLKDGWTKLMASLGMEHPEKCPQPAGTYHLINYAMPIETSAIPMLEGKYRIRQMFVTKNIDMYCILVIVNVKPVH